MLSGIHLLRGLAALLVAGFHIQAAARGGEGGNPVLFEVFRGGALGVDIFFVISGFIIYYTASRAPVWSARNFVSGRFFRIYPVYWIVLAAFIALAFGLWMLTGDASKLPSTEVLVRSILLLPSDQYAISIAWTLTIELLFYALFAAVFRGKGQDNSLLFVCMLSWALFSILFTATGLQAGGMNVIFHPAVSELLFGVVIAHIYLAGERRFANASFALGLGGTLATLLFVEGGDLHTWRSVIAGVPAALLVYGALGLRKELGFFGKLFGDASYLLYLIHIPAYLVIGFVFEKAFGISIYANDLTMGATLGLTFIAACAAHLMIERPYQAWYKSRTQRAKARERDLRHAHAAQQKTAP